MVAVDGNVNPGETLGKAVRGAVVHVLVKVPVSQAYRLYDPLGVLVGTNTPLDGVNVTFENVTLVPGWWSLKKPDGTEQTSFQAIATGELKDVAFSQVRTYTLAEFTYLLNAYGTPYYFQLQNLQCTSGFNSACAATGVGQNGNIALAAGHPVNLRIQFNISLSAVGAGPGPPPAGHYYVRSYVQPGQFPGAGDWAVPIWSGRPFVGGMGQPEQGRYEYNFAIMLMRLSPGRALTVDGDAYIREDPCVPDPYGQCGTGSQAATGTSVVQVSNS